MSGTRPEKPSPDETWLPPRVLVSGSLVRARGRDSRSPRRGARVLATDRSPDVDAGRLADLGVELRLGTEEESLLDGMELVVKSPGVPARVAARRGCPRARYSGLERGRARLPAAARRLAPHRHHGHEREDDDDRAARSDAPRSGSAGRGRGQRRPRPHRRRPDRGRRLVDRLRALELPARGRRLVRLRRRRPSQRRARPPRPARQLRRLPRLRSSAIFERARAKVVPRGFGIDGVEFSADDPLPAEPLHSRSRTTGRTLPPRPPPRAPPASPTPLSRDALATFPGVPHRLELVRELHGVRWVNDSKATNTAAARRGVAAYDAPLHLILGGSLKGEDFGPFAA